MLDVKIFQTFHKPFIRNKSCEWIAPIGVNGYSEDGFLSDSVGDNISSLNPFYCELTAQYWVWKNLTFDYVGFYHYRRYLNYQIDGTYDGIGLVECAPTDSAVGYLSSDTQRERLERLLNIAPVIIPRSHHTLPSISAQYLQCVNNEPWKIFIDYLIEAGEQRSEVEGYFHEITSAPMCNIMVMRWDLFSKYMSDLFKIIDIIFKRIGTKYDDYNNRYPGFLAERFLGYWIYTRGVKHTSVPMIFFN